MAAVTEKMVGPAGATGGARRDADLVRELDRRLRALRRYDRYLADAGGDAGLRGLWCDLGRQDLASVRRLKGLLIRHIQEGSV
jgi:hypothetical protein